MNLKSKIAAASALAAKSKGNPSTKKKTPAQPMQPMQAKRPTGITQNRPTGLAGANRPAAPAAPVQKTKADYKAELNSTKLADKYAKKAETRSYRQEKTAAKREMKLDKIKSGEEKNLAQKVERGAAAGSTVLALIEGYKKAFPGKKTGQGQNQNPG